MKSKIIYTLPILVLLPIAVFAQVENWIYTYDGPGNSADIANSIIYGADGKLYTAGYSTGWGTGYDFTVISLKTTDGDTNWIYRYNGSGNSNDVANSIIYGNDDNLYAAGYSYGEDTYADFIVISLDTQGDTNWIYRYDGPNHYPDQARSIVYGADGNLYAAGMSSGSSISDANFFVVSLDTAAGDTNWTYRNANSSNDNASSITYGADDNLYVAGHSRTFTTYNDFRVISLDTLGSERWIYTYNGAGNRDDNANSIIYGADGKVYAAGYSKGNGTGDDFTVISLKTTNGDTNWTYLYNPTNGNDQANKIIYGADGNLYAAGYSRGIGTREDFTVISLDTQGDTNWTYRYNGPGDSTDIAYSIFYGADGNIYATGYSYSGTNDDFLVVSLNAQGDENWIYRYNGSGDGRDRANSIIYGVDDNIYAAGYSTNPGTAFDFTVISLDTTLYMGDVKPISIDIDSLVPGNTKLLPQATVTNCGPHTETFEVTCEIDPGPYSSTDTIFDLASGDTMQITFPDTCLFETGSYTVKVYTQLRRDVNPANDTLEMVVFVDDTPPVAFSLVSPLDSTILSNPRPAFIWESSSDLVSGFRDYEIYIDDIVEHTGTDTAWTPDYDVQEGWHNWYVIAYDNFGNQQYSTETWSVLIDTTIPSIVTLISPADGACLNDATINFVWNSASDNLSGIDDYVLQYSQDNTFSSGVAEIIVIDTTFSEVLSDTIWYWRVKAKDKATNEGTWSSIWSFEIDTEIPDAPTLFSPVAGIWLSDTVVMFEWTEVMNLTIPGRRMHRVNSTRESDKAVRSQVKYIIQVDTLSSFVSPFIVDTVVETSTTAVLSENFYYWRVKAFDMAGNQGSFAGPDSFGVDMTIPVIESTTVWSDTSLTGPFEIRTKIIDNLSGVDSVLLYYRRDEDPEWISVVMMHLSEEPDWFLEFIPSVSNPADTVRYYIRAIDRSEIGNAVTDPETAPAEYYWFLANYNPGVMEHGDIPTSFSFGLQSNPARGKAVFHLALPHEAFVTLQIFDVSGRLIDKLVSERKSAGFHKIPWSSEISSGVYFYKLESPWENKVGKLVLVR